MVPIETTEPRPRDVPLAYQEFRFRLGPARYLEVPHQPNNFVFWDVALRRQSRRSFWEVSSAGLSALLWFTGKTLSQTRNANGIPWEHRCTPSAGGLHPIQIVLQPAKPDSLDCYDPLGHALRAITLNHDEWSHLRDYAATVLNPQAGTVLWLIGDFNKTTAIYADGDSLVWRDAGALIGMICIVGEALNLNCCPLGVCGGEVLKQVLRLPVGVRGVGAVIVGDPIPAP